VTVAAYDDHEVALLFEEIRGAYGYDFRGYSRSSMRQNLARHMAKARLSSLAQLRGRIRSDAGAFAGLLEDLTIRVTEMFRDPEFFAALRRLVVPLLRARAGLRLWIAGCATGEEVHSAAILLHEEGLLDRARLYATDLCPAALERAREGIYPAGQMRGWGESYRRAGGTDSFAGYFTVAHGYAAIRPELIRNVHFAGHDLTGDEVFGEMDAVLCRNVLIHFDRDLRAHALALLGRSLPAGGFLCLGSREQPAAHRHLYDDFAPAARIFRKRAAAGAAP